MDTRRILWTAAANAILVCEAKRQPCPPPATHRGAIEYCGEVSRYHDRRQETPSRVKSRLPAERETNRRHHPARPRP
jgi:hypothetical protein